MFYNAVGMIRTIVIDHNQLPAQILWEIEPKHTFKCFRQKIRTIPGADGDGYFRVLHRYISSQDLSSDAIYLYLQFIQGTNTHPGFLAFDIFFVSYTVPAADQKTGYADQAYELHH